MGAALALAAMLCAGAAATSEDCLSWYDYDAGAPAVEMSPLASRAGWREYQVTWQSRAPSGSPRNDLVHARYFVPEGARGAPAVIVLHGWGMKTAQYEIELSRRAAAAGIAAVQLTLPYHLQRKPPPGEPREMISADLDHSTRALRQAVIDVRSSIDWLRTRPEVDPQRIGVGGISLGALVGDVAFGVDERLAVGVSLLGGGDLPDLVQSSPLLIHLRRSLERREISQADLRERLRCLDPLTFAGRIPPRPMLMINGRDDVVMPPRLARRLWEAAGRPRMIWVRTGHYGLTLVRDQAYRVVIAFLRDAFGMSQGPLPPIYEETLRVGLFASPELGAALAITAVLARPGGHPLELSFTSNGPWLGLAAEDKPLELGVGMALGKAHLRVQPYLSWQITL